MHRCLNNFIFTSINYTLLELIGGDIENFMCCTRQFLLLNDLKLVMIISQCCVCVHVCMLGVSEMRFSYFALVYLTQNYRRQKLNMHQSCYSKTSDFFPQTLELTRFMF